MHFDTLVQEKEVVREYYTIEEAMTKYNITRDKLYYHVKKNNIPKKQEGRTVKIAKKELDFLFTQQPIILLNHV
ncbi:MAG: helix-turn-helix domain-containing protein [Prevotella sp.]|nr:helix-turn-helix domain-containing protein [Prevotella sp.]